MHAFVFLFMYIFCLLLSNILFLICSFCYVNVLWFLFDFFLYPCCMLWVILILLYMAVYTFSSLLSLLPKLPIYECMVSSPILRFFLCFYCSFWLELQETYNDNLEYETENESKEPVLLNP